MTESVKPAVRSDTVSYTHLCDNVSFSEQLVYYPSSFLAHLRVIDERSGKVRPLDLRRAAIQRRNALRGLTGPSDYRSESSVLLLCQQLF